MFDSSLLEVAIGLVLMFTLLSLTCSALAELLAQLFKLRAKNLALAVERLLTDAAVRAAFYQHPLITALTRGPDAPPRSMPSYIPGHTFASVLVQVVTRAPELAGGDGVGDEEGVDVEVLRARVAKLRDPGLRRILLAMLDDSRDELEDVQKAIVRWFEDTMDRAQGWYKRRAQGTLLAIATVVVVVTNADVFAVGETLWRDPTTRALVVTRATALVDEQPAAEAKVNAPQPDEVIKADLNRIQGLYDDGLPMGWKAESVPRTPSAVFVKIAGLLVTILAASQGAPFWFELLNKIVNLRGSGKRPMDPGAAKKTARRREDDDEDEDDE